ncbi:MAG: cytochrome c biogenesis CcdA family protein [Candidatus Thorarchaeota archaeon]|jgi:cytochrome c biogenesis protein CcdA
MQGVLEALLQIGASFSVGFYTAISPCLFPLLPLILIRTLQAENSRRRSLLVTMTLVLGILSSLALFSVISIFIGTFIVQNYAMLRAILGALIGFVGFLMLSEQLRKILRLNSMSLRSQPSAPTGLFSIYTIGLGYSLLAAPCTGPALISVFLLFGAQSDLFILLMMFLAISIGVTIPYLTLALLTGESRQRFTNTVTEKARAIEIGLGILLIVLAIILILPYFGVLILI